MRVLIVGMFLLVACGGPIVSTTADAGMEETPPTTSTPPPPPTFHPLCVTWGQTTTQVSALAGPPEYVGPLTGVSYADTLWRYNIPSCGDWFVTFKTGVVTARFGLAGGCNPVPASECPPG